MRLLKHNNDGALSLTNFFGDDIPPYAILSHIWRAEEFTFAELMAGTGREKAGYNKIRFCGEQARRDGLQYFWVGTCCIDKSSSTSSERLTVRRMAALSGKGRFSAIRSQKIPIQIFWIF
jgi:hypothetical protein